MPRPQIDGLLDYIDFLHPGLKGDTSNLSAILPSIVDSGLPPQKIVLEMYSIDRLEELNNQPFNELFKSCSGRDSHRPVAAAGLRFDQMPATDNSQSLSFSVGMSSEDPSNSMVDSCEFAYPPAHSGRLHDSQELGQLFDAQVDASFNSQVVNSPLLAQQEFFDMEIPNFQSDYPPVPEQFDLYENECGATSLEHHSSNAYGCEAPSQDNDGLSAQLLDIPQQMDWTNNNQGVRTVNPKDLMLYPFPLTAIICRLIANIAQEPGQHFCPVNGPR
jgi:hypothetical protein